jgi:hypothetical protein
LAEYTAHTWSTGDVITASLLNANETGTANALAQNADSRGLTALAGNLTFTKGSEVNFGNTDSENLKFIIGGSGIMTLSTSGLNLKKDLQFTKGSEVNFGNTDNQNLKFIIGGSGIMTLSTSGLNLIKDITFTKGSEVNFGNTDNQNLKFIIGGSSAMVLDTSYNLDVSGEVTANDYQILKSNAGTQVINNTVTAGSTLNVDIALGDNYKRGRCVIKSTNVTFNSGIMVFFDSSTNNSHVVGTLEPASGVVVPSAWDRGDFGLITTASGDGYPVYGGDGYNTSSLTYIRITQCFINGTDLRITLQNQDGVSDHTAPFTVFWEVFN